MNSSRLLLICPLFWPSSEPRSHLATALAKTIADSGHEVTVVTRHLIGYWPRTFRMGNVNVFRLSQRSKRLMDSVRSLGGRDPWISELSRWLLANRNQFDFAIVVAGDGEIPSIASLLKRWKLDSVIRFEDWSSIASHMDYQNREPAIGWVTPFGLPEQPEPVHVVADGADSCDYQVDNRQSIRAALKMA
jgi:hypothetical protein